jgi:hypothetical protein
MNQAGHSTIDLYTQYERKEAIVEEGKEEGLDY